MDGEHTYKHPDDGAIIVHPRTQDRSTGNIWCWSHAKWENNIPDAWLNQEQTFRDAITDAWQHLRSAEGNLAFQSPELTDRIGQYCAHRWWKKPDWNDRYSVYRFIHDLETEKPIR
jgi:hypothetical protein